MPPSKKNAKKTAPLKPCDSQRLLIVDDDAAVRQTFQAIISGALPDLKIDIATDGTEAVEVFRAAHQGIVLMDIYLPVMNGLEAYNQIELQCSVSKWQMPRMVFCSGFFPSATLKGIVEANPEHCILHKPVRNELLIETIKERMA